MRIASWLVVVAAIALQGCEGGADGEDGTSCTVTDNGDGTVTIRCDDGTSVTVSDGADGTSCTIADNGDGSSTITCEDGTSVTIADGENGGPIALDPDGVVGVVADRSGALLTSGTIYFVPAADVAALPATTISPTSDNDEPLEDLIAANGAGYQKAAVGADGRYRLDTLAAGAYFVTFKEGDLEHLPGGSACRIASASAHLIGTRLDIDVSSRPPADARYIGSSRCVGCHGDSHVSGTMHRLGIWSPYETGLLQDQSARYDELWQALAGKFTAAGTTVWFYNYPAGTGFDKYDVSETDPASFDPPNTTASFKVTVRSRLEAGQPVYEMMLENLKNAADPNDGVVYKVDAVYGGGVWKQRYLTKVVEGGELFYMTLPLQFNTTGDDTYGPRTSRVWRDYHGDYYYDEATSTLKALTVAGHAGKGFEKNCISCHANGVQVTQDGSLFRASLVSDPIWGDFDYDGDGLKDEVNLGCETCHGPGSAHWASVGQGKAIVSPSLLTPEREAMICGQCHSRPKGALGSDSPVNASGWMMWAGTSRAQFLAEYATTQLDGAASDFHGDPARHSKSHHQQYSDFIRSAMYKNDTQLMTCSDCHDPHQRENTRQLRSDPADEEALCGGACHGTQTADKVAHMTEKIGFGGGAMANATCVQCHMPKTAKTGAGWPGAMLGGVQYWESDVSSHIFDMPTKQVTADFGVPTGYIEACGDCHDAP